MFISEGKFEKIIEEKLSQNPLSPKKIFFVINKIKPP